MTTTKTTTFPQGTRELPNGAQRGLRGCTTMLRDQTKPSRLTVCSLKRGHAEDHGSTLPGDWGSAADWQS